MHERVWIRRVHGRHDNALSQQDYLSTKQTQEQNAVHTVAERCESCGEVSQDSLLAPRYYDRHECGNSEVLPALVPEQLRAQDTVIMPRRTKEKH